MRSKNEEFCSPSTRLFYAVGQNIFTMSLYIDSVTSPVFTLRASHGTFGSACSPQRKTERVESKPNDPFTVPETIRKMYNVTIRGDAAVIQAAAEFPDNWHQLGSDLAKFGEENGLAGRLEIAKFPSHPDPAPNSTDPNGISDETTLDVQYVGGVGLSNTNWLWNSEDWVFELTQELQNATTRPSVISMSYGWSEVQQCGSVVSADCRALKVNSEQYVNRTSFELSKVALLGTTMLASSGDSGCHGQ